MIILYHYLCIEAEDLASIVCPQEYHTILIITRKHKALHKTNNTIIITIQTLMTTIPKNPIQPK